MGIRISPSSTAPANRFLRKALVSFSLCAAADIAQAQSIAASLSNYEATLKVPSVAGVSASSFSGVAFHTETRTLYVIDDANATIYELNPSGILVRSIAISGFLDTEGIAYQGNDFFLIAEEGLMNIVRIKLPRTGSGPVAKASGTALNLGANQGNSGLEGVSYRPADKTVYAVKETAPPRFYRIALDAAGVPNASFPNDPIDIEGKSGDAADAFALNDGNFIIVNQEQNKLEGYGPAGQTLSSLSLGMNKPEGITIDPADGTIYVVGELAEFGVFKKKNSQARKMKAGKKGFSCSLVPGNVSGAGPAIRFSLPYRTSIRIDFSTLDGAWEEAFDGIADEGVHFYCLTRPNPAGIGCYRFSTGSFQRTIKVISL